jgi:hypothetical protein
MQLAKDLAPPIRLIRNPQPPRCAVPELHICPIAQQRSADLDGFISHRTQVGELSSRVIQSPNAILGVEKISALRLLPGGGSDGSQSPMVAKCRAVIWIV